MYESILVSASCMTSLAPELLPSMATLLQSKWGGVPSAQLSPTHRLQDARFERIQTRRSPARGRASVRTTKMSCATEIDVAIVGGGPGGLAAAAAITSAFDNSLNIKVTVLRTS